MPEYLVVNVTSIWLGFAAAFLNYDLVYKDAIFAALKTNTDDAFSLSLQAGLTSLAWGAGVFLVTWIVLASIRRLVLYIQEHLDTVCLKPEQSLSEKDEKE